MKKFLTNFDIKIVALLSMTLDHLGFFFDINLFRTPGRLAFPLFAFLIAEGALHTRNIGKYFSRLFSFAVIIELGLLLAKSSIQISFNYPKNIFFTLSLGLLCIMIYKSSFSLKYPAILIFILAAELFKFDFGLYGILMILLFYICRGDFLLIILGLIILNSYYTLRFETAIQWYTLFCLPLIFAFNGQRGRNIKYVFYLYYPLHFVLLYVIYSLVH